MASIRVGDIDIHYELEGKPDAPVLVLSNSLGATGAMWTPQSALRDEYRVLTYDTRGHGQSARPKGPYTLDQLGRDVIGLLDALAIDQAAFCGISMGGITALWLALNAPDRIVRAAACNTAARIGTEQGWRDRAALVRAQGMDPVADSSASRWFTPAFVQAHPGQADALVGALRAGDAEGYAACCDALATADLRDDIARIGIPTLVVAGRHDPVTTLQDADFMMARIPGAQRVDLDAAHLSNVEAPEAFNQALRAFLGD